MISNFFYFRFLFYWTFFLYCNLVFIICWYSFFCTCDSLMMLTSTISKRTWWRWKVHHQIVSSTSSTYWKVICWTTHQIWTFSWTKSALSHFISFSILCLTIWCCKSNHHSSMILFVMVLWFSFFTFFVLSFDSFYSLQAFNCWLNLIITLDWLIIVLFWALFQLILFWFRWKICSINTSQKAFFIFLRWWRFFLII